MQHWIFDLDGTLVNSFPSFTRVITEVVEDYGVTLTADDLELISSLIPPKFLARVLPPEHIESAFAKVIAITLERQDEIPIYGGVEELLIFLRSKNCILSLFTARERKTTLGILKATGLDQHFSHVVTRDCVANCKPFPDGIHHILEQSKVHPESAVMIGDHVMDMESAKSAGVTGISVNWDGNHSHAAEFSDLHFTNISELHTWAVARF